jgi:hypothetical protein
LIGTTIWPHLTQWKYGLKRNKTTREPNDVHEGKQLNVGKKRSWHDVQDQNLLETSNPTNCNLFTWATMEETPNNIAT